MSAACASAIVVFTLIVIAGWALDQPLLKRGLLSSNPVRPNTAIGLLFAGASLLVHRRTAAARLFALVPALLGGATLADYLFGLETSIHELFFRANDPAYTPQVSVRGSIGLFFAGLALLCPRPGLARAFAGITAFIGVVSTVAFVYGATFLPHAGVPEMALSTAVLFIIWTVAFAAATIQDGAAATLLLRDRWGSATRTLSAVALFAPVLFGAICVLEVHAHLFDMPFAVALMTTASSFSLIIVTALYIHHLRQSELARAAADTLYRTIVEMSQEGICVADGNFRFQFANRRLAAMLGYEPHELIGQHASLVVHEDDRAGVAERLAQRRSGVESTRTEMRLMHRDGSIVHAISAATQIQATASSPDRILSTLSDITERVESERALRASEARFRGLYDSNLIGVAFWSYDGTVSDANDAFLRLFDLKREELPGWRWSSRHVPDSDAEAIDQAAIWHLRETGRCAPFEKEHVRPDGSRFFALVGLAAVDAETNLGFVIDITERVEARRKLERAHAILSARVSALEGNERLHDELETLAARLTEAHEELESFSYSVSHDLRAPLRAIDGFTRELQLGYEPLLDAQGRDYLGRIRAAAHRMSLLIDDLLALSRVSNTVVHRTRVDVSAIAREVASETRERSGCDVAFSIDEGLAATADPHLVRVVLENLIGNAVKFSSRREQPRVEVFRDSDGSIAVRDNGAGFDMRHAQKVFMPFQRLHSTEFEGTGIGLALVHRIISRHGGAIRAESAPDAGATFFFNLSPSQEAA